MTTEQLIGVTTQSHTFGMTDSRPGAANTRYGFQRVPAGTEVYVRAIRRDGTCEVRIPGTSLTQRVYLSTIQPA